MPIGNVNSNERGSGARYNDGKPNLSLIPLWTLYANMSSKRLHPAELTLDYLGEFQRTGDPEAVRRALLMLGGGRYPLEPAARVFQYGARKYAAWNWAKGMAWSIPIACAARHLKAVLDGEDLDPESGEPHYGHAACNLFMLLHFVKYYPEGNDLPPQVCFNKQEPESRVQTTAGWAYE